MARKLLVEIVGDSTSLEKSFKRSTASANKFSNDIGKLGRGGFAATGAFNSLGRSVAFASTSFLGGFGLVTAIKSSVDAASDLEQQISKTNVVFGSSGQAVVDWSQTLVRSFGLSQREALATVSSLGALLKPIGITGSAAAKQSEKLTQLGADLASFYNTDVADALAAIQSGLVGESEPLRRYGVQLSEVRVQQEALNETGKRSVKSLTLQDKALARINLIFKDAQRAGAVGDFVRTQETLANRLKIARANIQDLEATIGQTLIPVLNEVVGQFSDWISQTRNQQTVLKNVRAGVSLLKDALGLVRDAFERLNGVTGSTLNSLKLLAGAFVVYKTLRIVSTLAGIASSIGLIGTNARTATGQVTGLRAAMGKLAPVAVGITLAIGITQTKEYKSFRKWLDEHLPGGKGTGKALFGTFGEQVKTFVKPFQVILKDEANKGPVGLLRKLLGDTKKQGKITGEGIRKIGEDVGKAIRGVAERAGELGAPQRRDALTKKELREQQARVRAARDAVRQEAQDRAGLAVDRAGLTKTLTDDLAALEAQNDLLKRRIAGGHDTLQILQEQIAVQKQIQEVQQQIVQQRIDRLQFGVDLAATTSGLRDDLVALANLRSFLVKRLAADKGNLDLQRQILDVNQQIKEVQKKRRDAAQFRRLGLGPTGEDLVPGVANLKKQLASVRNVIEGTFLDTNKTRGILGNIRQVLSGRLGSVSAEVRSKVQSILADLRQQLKQSSVDVTRFHKSAAGQFVLAGAHPQGSGTVTIQGGIHLHGVQNVQQMEEQLAKRRKQRAHARRGTR